MKKRSEFELKIIFGGDMSTGPFVTKLDFDKSIYFDEQTYLSNKADACNS